MNAVHLSLEMAAIKIRTQRLVAFSFGLHLLLFLWFTLIPKITQEELTLTEITWIEPVQAAPPSLPALIAKAELAEIENIPLEKPSVHEKREHFKREHPLADVVLEPQSQEVVADKLKERLAVLQRKKTEKSPKVVALTPSSPVGRPALAGFADETRSKDRPKDLTRHKPTGSAPVELKRSPEKIQRTTMLVTQMPERTVKPIESEKTDTQAQRTIAGASLTGPVADRPLISFTKPEYPEWAKKEAVEGSVTIYFLVLPNGHIKENVMVQKTSGFGDFDENAINALLAWRFEPVEKSALGEQWGTITFHYRLSDSY